MIIEKIKSFFANDDDNNNIFIEEVEEPDNLDLNHFHIKTFRTQRKEWAWPSKTLKYSKIYEDVPDPERANPADAGIDMRFYHTSPIEISQGESVKLGTGVKFEVPEGYMVEIMNRSSIAKDGVLVGAHVIDAGYKGEIIINLHNFSDKDFVVKPGDRIAQAVCKPICTPEPKEVQERELYKSREVNSDRGEGGFGSTGRI